MTWTTEVDSPDVWIGYAAGSESVYSNLYSFTQQAFRMDTNSATNGTCI